MTTTTSNKTFVLALLVAAQFMVILDASIVNVALPSLGDDLDFSQQNLAWVINAYVLAFGGFLLLGGRIADLAGRRATFIGGLGLFSAASLAAGFAPSEGALIAARAVQGLGAAVLSPAALSILVTLFADGAERNKALGVWGAASGAAGATGVLMGGLFTDTIGWEWVFWVNVPIGAAAALLAPRLLPESRQEDGARSFDVLGAVTVTASLSLLVYAIIDAVDVGWGSTQTVSLLAASAALMAAFVVIELRSKSPMVPFRFFRSRSVSAGNVTSLLLGAPLFAMFFFVTLYMQQVLGYGPLETGFAYLAFALPAMVASGVASQAIARVCARALTTGGLALAGAGLFLFAQVPVNGSYVGDLLVPMLMTAIGFGTAFVSVTVAATLGVREEESGLASGLVNTGQQIGAALGLGIMATIATSRTEDLLGGGSELPLALTEGFQDAFVVGSGLALAGAAIAFVALRSPRRRTAAPRGEAAAQPAAS
jgi:EmrB/QacA subfamily drug resistance transporter